MNETYNAWSDIDFLTNEKGEHALIQIFGKCLEIKDAIPDSVKLDHTILSNKGEQTDLYQAQLLRNELGKSTNEDEETILNNSVILEVVKRDEANHFKGVVWLAIAEINDVYNVTFSMKMI